MTEGVVVQKGLRDVAFTTTAISEIDGERGHLSYRGHAIGDLVERYTYEDVLHLLLRGNLPDSADSSATRTGHAGTHGDPTGAPTDRATAHRDQVHAARDNLGIGLQDSLYDILSNARKLPGHVKDMIRDLPADIDAMSALRTSISALGDTHSTWPPSVEQAAEVIAKIPTLVAFRHRVAQGLEPVEPDPALSLAANYLFMLSGERPSETKTQALDAYLVLTAEHGMNASTFAARVTASTQSDLISAFTTAVGTLKGPLHGGAPSEVSHMLKEIGRKERAEAYLRSVLERGERIMGFGHRVYRTKDPRALALASVARRLAENEPWFDLAIHVEAVATRLLEEHKPGRRLHTNVEFYAAAVLHAIDLPPTLFTPTFTIARAGGWAAHILEQAADNQIIRPRAIYRPSDSL